jgi:transposase
VIRYRPGDGRALLGRGNTVPAIARLVAADEDTVREVIHRGNQLGMRALDPRWAGGRSRRLSVEDEKFLVATARTRPENLGRPFTHWSLRKLVGYLADNAVRIVRISRELCFTPIYASWANPSEAHFGPLRSFVLANSAYTNHGALTRSLHAHLRWRATPMPATPTCSSPNDENAPGFAASITAAGPAAAEDGGVRPHR